MPNWCNNWVTCTGSAEAITNLKNILEKHVPLRGEGTDFGFLSIKEGYFFDIYVGDHEPTMLTFSYETKWSPNLSDLAEFCMQLGVSASCEYSEGGMEIYGFAQIDSNGEIISKDDVPTEFLKLIEYDDNTFNYVYNGEKFELIEEIIESHYKTWKSQQQ